MAYNISYVSGHFQHDTQPIGPDTCFRATTLPSLGLLDVDYGSNVGLESSAGDAQWQRFLHWVKSANEKSKDVQYKLLVVVRHGEADHNVKEHGVGRHAWEDHWAKLDGDGTTTWADAGLTDKGKTEAQQLGQFWSHDMLPRGVAFPEALYSSPLTRCIQTTLFTWEGLGSSSDRYPVIHVAEQLRETIGVHTCDRRSTRSDIKTAFPSVVFEEDFTETDELWQNDLRETPDECTQRVAAWLQTLFDQEESQMILVASHSGSIRALLKAVGHPDVWPGRGSMSPLLLKAEKLHG